MKSVNVKTPDALGGESIQQVQIEGEASPSSQLLTTLIDIYSIKASAPLADLLEVAAIGSFSAWIAMWGWEALYSLIPFYVVASLCTLSGLCLSYLSMERKQYRIQITIKLAIFTAGIALALPIL